MVNFHISLYKREIDRGYLHVFIPRCGKSASREILYKTSFITDTKQHSSILTYSNRSM